ncbi:hypothetical protein [Haloarchaeobius amylolyticus]|uniref:hypothetical protein n=1 Tax=Haloarchaeobius amylolyticus TaxID=1198296 RepID=UPI002271F83F|nr:hypothetical protein [Haloarchaeobius amylolyticus]
MNWLKVLGVLVPLGILASGLGALATMGTNLDALTGEVTLVAVAAGFLVVLAVMGAVSVVGARSKEWRANTYW